MHLPTDVMGPRAQWSSITICEACDAIEGCKALATVWSSRPICMPSSTDWLHVMWIQVQMAQVSLDSIMEEARVLHTMRQISPSIWLFHVHGLWSSYLIGTKNNVFPRSTAAAMSQEPWKPALVKITSGMGSNRDLSWWRSVQDLWDFCRGQTLPPSLSSWSQN